MEDIGLHRLVLEKHYHLQVMAGRHLAIEAWLGHLGLMEYYSNFAKYSGVEALLILSETEVRDIGVKNSAHRARIVTSLKILREKYERSAGKRNSFSSSSLKSLDRQQQVTPPSPISHSDYAHVPVTPEKLEHDLRQELTADASELKSRSWYHGNISRQKSERLVVNNGDYLVRDCISQPGDFVLTCVWKGVPLHFVINSKISEEKSGPPKVWYRFEEEEFTSVQALAIFYLNHAKPITHTSGTVITNPIARCLPLSYYDTKYGALAGLAARLGHGTYTPTQSPKPSPFVTPTSSPYNSPVITRRSLTVRTGSQPLLSVEEDGPTKHIDRCDSLPAIGITMPNGETPNIYESSLPIQHHRSGSEPLLTPTNKSLSFNNLSLPTVKLTPATSDGNIGRPAPPKPSRIPSIKYKNRPLVVVRNRQLYEDDGTDYSDYDQAKSEPSWLKPMQSTPVAQDNVQTRDNSLNSSDSENVYDNNINKMPVHGVYDNTNMTNGKEPPSRLRLFSDTRFSIIDTYEEVTPSPKEHAIDEDSSDSFPFIDEDIKNKNFTMPIEDANILLNTFASELLPTDNKPLEPSTMISIRTLLLECNAKKLALHVTKVDLDFLSSVEEKDLGMGVNSGLELITLPQGKQLRQDVIERCCCMKVFCAGMIVTCGSIRERARMLSQWIQICMELKTGIGNLFGFAAIMEGLLMPQILRLRDTWLILRQNHTSSAFLFDTKLRTAFKSLNDGTGTLPLQNICLPNISSMVQLMERDVESLMDMLSWEIMDADSGLDILLAHLDTARIVASQVGLYRLTGEAVLKDFKEDQDMLDIFRTEFHLKLFWGRKGAVADKVERHNKIEQLLTILSQRAEREGDDGTAV